MLVARLLVVFVVVCCGVCAQAQTHSLAVYSSTSDSVDDIAAHSLKVELQRLLRPAGIEISWHVKSSTSASEEVERLVVGTFEGSCDVQSISRRSESAAVRAYAETIVSSGKILPYFRVDCSRVLRTLAPTFGPLSVPMRQGLMGRALARVMAHEIYHILAETSVHASVGVAKSSLSAEDLLAEKFDFSQSSLLRIQTASSDRSLAPPVPDVASLVPARR